MGCVRNHEVFKLAETKSKKAPRANLSISHFTGLGTRQGRYGEDDKIAAMERKREKSRKQSILQLGSMNETVLEKEIHVREDKINDSRRLILKLKRQDADDEEIELEEELMAEEREKTAVLKERLKKMREGNGILAQPSPVREQEPSEGGRRRRRPCAKKRLTQQEIYEEYEKVHGEQHPDLL